MKLRTTHFMIAATLGVFLHGPANAMNAGQMAGVTIEPTQCSVQSWTTHTTTEAKCKSVGGTWGAKPDAAAPASGDMTPTVANPGNVIGVSNSMINR